jgi:hypothetical protein
VASATQSTPWPSRGSCSPPEHYLAIHDYGINAFAAVEWFCIGGFFNHLVRREHREIRDLAVTNIYRHVASVIATSATITSTV